MSQCPTKLQLFPAHTHTVFSVLDGASTIDEYITWCKENGSRAVGVSDHGWFIGGLELFLKAKKAGLIPIPGVEFYLAPQRDHVFKTKPYDYYHVTVWAINEVGYRNLLKLSSISWNDTEIDGWRKDGDIYKPSKVTRVVKKINQIKPRITFDELLENHEGLVLGSGCLLGSLSKSFLQGEFDQAERNLLRLMEVYKGRIFAEIFSESCTHDWHRKEKVFKPIDPEGCNGMSLDGDIQKGVNLKLIETARKYRLPLFLSIDSHFVKPSQKMLQDVLLGNGEQDNWKFHSVYSMLTTEEAWQKWEKTYGNDIETRKIFAEAVLGNDILASLAKDFEIKDGYHQPTPTIPPDIEVREVSYAEKKKQTLLRQIEYHGRMCWDDPKWVKRLKTEIKVICDNGVVDFSDYFLFLEQWCRWASEHSILSAPGRGSGAGSLLCYLLKITHLDVFEYDLPFERFLSQGRISRSKFPDIDWDVGNRDLLIAKLRGHYGDKMAQCSTLQTLKVRSAIKDACRSLLGWNSSDPRVDAITKTVSIEPQGVSSKDFLIGYLDQDGQAHDGEILINDKLYQFFVEYPNVKDMVLQLLGIPRSVGRHASAFLISDRPIYESVPTCNVGGYVCTQYTANGANMVEKAGLIKFDFLRINTLDDISGCIRLVQKKLGFKVWEEKLTFNDQIREKEYTSDQEIFKTTKGDLPIDKLPMPDGRVFDVYNLPIDQNVFESLSEGNTETVFQMNTPLMTGFTKRIRPNSIKDLSDILALVRPGPLSADSGVEHDGEPVTMTEAYIKRRNKEIPISYVHRDMEPIVKDTFGIFVYQEQLAKAFVDLAGYSHEEADEFREILGKKKKQELEKRIPQLRERLKERKWNDHQIEVFVSVCVAASQYSFNRSHSAAYGTVAYQCAFLKYHFPLEWWTAVLQNAKVEDIKEKGYVKAVKDILILPHVNGPGDTFRLQDNKIHAPLYLIDRIGDTACFKIQNEREANGRYTSLQNFFDRVSVDQTVFHNLILCDAFREIEPDRSIQDMMEEYHYLRRVTSLKLGKDESDNHKTGEELKEAVRLYKEKELETGKKLEVPELYHDRMSREIARLSALPIYRINIHEDFKDLLQHKGISYTSENPTVRMGSMLSRVFRNTNEIVVEQPSEKGIPGGYAGLLQSHETFQYTDKKSKKKVTALKMMISNDGDSVEAVVWPNTYQQMVEAGIQEPPSNKIVLVTGTIRESREPGRWSLSVQKMRFI